MFRVVVERKDGEVLYVRSGEIGKAWDGSSLGFQFLKLTKSKSHARYFQPIEAEDVASAINRSLDIGFYSSLGLSYARVGAEFVARKKSRAS